MPAKRGVIYVLTNRYFARNIVKIGMTERTATLRARELSTATGVPDDFEVAYEQIVSDAITVESKVHELLADYRLNKRREFFQLPTMKAIEVVRSVAAEYLVDEENEADEIDVLPGFESRMRRWLRSDLVAVSYHQFSDLCVVKWVTQPDLSSEGAIEHIFDLSVIAGHPLESVPPYDGRWFSPVRNTPEENARELLVLDAYSMIMTGLDILSEEAMRYVADLWELHKTEPPIQLSWRVVEQRLDMWGNNEYPSVDS
ncbi:GIY-YIG nuclease family protein [Glycomyces lechevalierae]|uniref:GIY-YIG nuclease family protein n=1 Tax=Glycomyces lechevalierae TaxID=256034 RepID=A0A9X3SWU6_9ACTN|nr:GIY-YIG nuclease family protein [Glycomyces lechevalierae]